jgi:hypothetical protein
MNWQHVFDLLQGEMASRIMSGSAREHVRLQFNVAGCNREQKELLRELTASLVLGNVTSLGPVEME